MVMNKIMLFCGHFYRFLQIQYYELKIDLNLIDYFKESVSKTCFGCDFIHHHFEEK